MLSRRSCYQLMNSSKKNATRSTFRRGFKKEADELARELRAELGLRPQAPLDPMLLADHLMIPVRPLSDLLVREEAAVQCLLGPEAKAFSAATVFDGSRRMILYNDSHHAVRRASSVAHELAHGLLMHPPGPPLSENGCRHYDHRLESEASWLGPALLVSQEAAFEVAWKRIPLPESAALYGVSQQLMRMRLNVTGAKRIASRTRSRRFASR